jgi:hypothetical protein
MKTKQTSKRSGVTMTYPTGESIENTRFRYHIYVKDEVVCLSKTMIGVKGFLLAFQQEIEFRGFWVTVYDTFLPGSPKIIQEEGGKTAPTADILPFGRK